MGKSAVSGPTTKMVTVFLQQSGQKMQNNPDMLHSGKFILIIIQKQDTVAVAEYYVFSRAVYTVAKTSCMCTTTHLISKKVTFINALA